MSNSDSYFVIYDFEIADLPLVLGSARAKLPGLSYAGEPGDKKSGEIWRSVVQPGISRSRRVVAYVDNQNANVGYEIGYTMGQPDTALGLFRFRDSHRPWMRQCPLKGQKLDKVSSGTALAERLQGGDFMPSLMPPVRGEGVLYLCPRDGPGADALHFASSHGWKTVTRDDWSLLDMPAQLHEIGHVVWIVAPPVGDPAEDRDGSENAAHAILVGYAGACGLAVHMYYYDGRRLLQDIVSAASAYRTFQELEAKLDALAGELSRPPASIEPETSESTLDFPIGVLPEIDDADLIASLFIGRAGILDDMRSAFQQHARTRVFYIWGTGGMGKSWLLRKACLVAALEGGFRYGLIDWDLSTLRGNYSDVRDTERMFIVVAQRLAQLRGTSTIAPFIAARARVQAAADLRFRIRRKLNEDMDLARGEQSLPAPFRRFLEAQGLWHENSDDRRALLEGDRRLSRSPQRLHDWTEECWHEPLLDREATLEPERVLADALSTSLRKATEAGPLLLAIDTCELLNEDQDYWLREAIAAALQGNSRLWVVLAGRLGPELDRHDLDRKGWRTLVGDVRFRGQRLDEGFAFELEEIEELLQRVSDSWPDLKQLATALHRVTGGHPFSIHVLLSLHEQGSEILGDAQALSAMTPEHALGEEAIDHLVRAVAQRYLLHLERRPKQFAEEMEDIVALTLIPQIDPAILRELWGNDVRGHLLDLARRSALITAGDLPQNVRRVLRLHWRLHDRPRCFDKVRMKLLQIERQLARRPENLDDQARRLEHRVRELDLQSWGDDIHHPSLVYGAACLCVVHGVPLDSTVRLMEELVREPAHGAAIARLSKRAESGHPCAGTIADLFPQVTHPAHILTLWTPEERKASELLQAFAHTRAGEEPALRTFLDALLPFVDQRPACAGELAHALFQAALFLQQRKQSPELVRRAYLICVSWGHFEGYAHNNLGNLLANHRDVLVTTHDFADRDAVIRAARDHYLLAIEKDSKNAYPENNLANLLSDHTECFADGRPFADPRAVFRAARDHYLLAIEKDPKYASPENDLANLLSDHIEFFADGRLFADQDAVLHAALDHYLLAIEKDPKDAIPENNLANTLASHCDVFAVGARFSDRDAVLRAARDHYLLAIEKDPKYAGPENGLGSLLHTYYRAFAEELGSVREVLDSSRARYLSSIVKDPLYATPEANLGELLFQHGHTLDDTGWPESIAQARSRWEAALLKQPSYVSARASLGFLMIAYPALTGDGDPDAVRRQGYAQIADALALQPKNRNVLFASAFAAWRAASREEAREAFKETTRLADTGWIVGNEKFDALLVLAALAQGDGENLLHILEAAPRCWQSWKEALQILVDGRDPQPGELSAESASLLARILELRRTRSS